MPTNEEYKESPWKFIEAKTREVEKWPEWKKEGWDMIEISTRSTTLEFAEKSDSGERSSNGQIDD